ncbi:MAG TPA: AMP-binding protein [Acidimicrobiales bacterium]|nr:AMP-binding protein [Acidimicrobiales bacterium]
MAELVALDLPGGAAFVRAVLETWSAGNAVAPIDRRLAPAARERLLEALAPSRTVTPTGTFTHSAGRPVQDGDAVVMATGGSTGEPKGAVLTHEAVAASARATSERLGADPRRHRWVACLPLSHIGGFSVVSRALLTGTPLDVHEGFDPARVIGAAGPGTLVSLVPTALSRVGAADFYKVLLGGSAPPPDLPPNVVTTYGMTETGSGVVYDGVPLAGVEVAIDRSGEIRLRGPMLLRAYRDDTVPFDGEGWLPTGDRGYLDEQGRLRVEGRLSDMVVTGGENVWPLAVERVLAEHPGVAEVAVSSCPDPEWGERLVACVVPLDEHHPPSLPELRALVKDHLAPFAAPRELLFFSDLPKTPLGKLRRDELRRRLLLRSGAA